MTALWTSDALEAATGGVMTHPFHASGVSIDTRTLRSGDLFVALVGEHGDGHDHLAAAFAAGAGGAVVHRHDAIAAHHVPDGAGLLIVNDTRQALTSLGAYGRGRFTGSVIAVTGSVGKTSTKEMLRLILAESGRVEAAAASYNNHWGVPLTLARLDPDADYAVVEIGMNHPGEIGPLARLALPDVAIVTAIAAAHIGHLGSLEAIADEKAAIIDGVAQGGHAVLPAGPHLARLMARAHGLHCVVVGEAEGDSRLLAATQLEPGGSGVTATILGQPIRFWLAVPGTHMVANALAALTAAVLVGAPLAPAAARLASFAGLAGRGEQRPLLDGAARLLDESYNASGASVRAALAVLRLLPAGRRVAVLGDMRELGEHATAEHRELAEPVAANADLLYACGEHMQALFEAVPERCRGAWQESAELLAPIVADALAPGDAVLVKGSLGSRMRVVVAALEAKAA